VKCPLCCQDADLRCGGCGARIERNRRGEADRAYLQHDGRWTVAYMRRQNAHIDNDVDGPRRAELHTPTSDRFRIGVDLELPVGLDTIRTFGRTYFRPRRPERYD